MDDQQIHDRINELVADEHELRGRAQDGQGTTDDERARLRSLEQSLDQCWDLLRQRDARREAGLDPDGASARPVAEVEGYRQ